MSTSEPARRPGAGPPLTVIALGLFASTAALLAGGWLLLAPFALGYQPDGADWSEATVVDFVTGLILLVLGAISGAVGTAGLVARLTPTRPRPPSPAEPSAADTELLNLLRPLVTALGHDGDHVRAIDAADTGRP